MKHLDKGKENLKEWKIMSFSPLLVVLFLNSHTNCPYSLQNSSPCFSMYSGVVQTLLSVSLAPRVGGWLDHKGFSVPASLPTESLHRAVLNLSDRMPSSPAL